MAESGGRKIQGKGRFTGREDSWGRKIQETEGVGRFRGRGDSGGGKILREGIFKVRGDSGEGKIQENIHGGSQGKIQGKIWKDARRFKDKSGLRREIKGGRIWGRASRRPADMHPHIL